MFQRGAMTGIANQSREPAAAHTQLGYILSWSKPAKNPLWPSFPEGFGTWEAMVLRWAQHNKNRAGLELKGAALTSAGLGWRGHLLEPSLHSPRGLWQQLHWWQWTEGAPAHGLPNSQMLGEQCGAWEKVWSCMQENAVFST